MSSPFPTWFLPEQLLWCVLKKNSLKITENNREQHYTANLYLVHLMIWSLKTYLKSSITWREFSKTFARVFCPGKYGLFFIGKYHDCQRGIQNSVKHLRYKNACITVNYFWKRVHLRCLEGFWVHLWLSFLVPS